MTFILFLLFSFLMTGLNCCCTVHPKHPLHSYHGFVFCFINSFYLPLGMFNTHRKLVIESFIQWTLLLKLFV